MDNLNRWNRWNSWCFSTEKSRCELFMKQLTSRQYSTRNWALTFDSDVILESSLDFFMWKLFRELKLARIYHAVKNLDNWLPKANFVLLNAWKVWRDKKAHIWSCPSAARVLILFVSSLFPNTQSFTMTKWVNLSSKKLKSV